MNSRSGSPSQVVSRVGSVALFMHAGPLFTGMVRMQPLKVLALCQAWSAISVCMHRMVLHGACSAGGTTAYGVRAVPAAIGRRSCW